MATSCVVQYALYIDTAQLYLECGNWTFDDLSALI